MLTLKDVWDIWRWTAYAVLALLPAIVLIVAAWAGTLWLAMSI